MTKQERIAVAKRLQVEHPAWDHQRIADEMGISMRTVYRYLGAQTAVEKEEETIQVTDPSEVRILLMDIETSLIRAYVWSTGQQYVGPDQIEDDFSILCWAAKWLYSPRVYSARVSGEEALAHEDASIMKRLWSMLDKAHYIVAHNANRFDKKKVNARFLLNGLPKPSPYEVIDTLSVSRKNFGFSSHKMDYIQKQLGMTRKTETGYELWKQADKGNEASLRKMDKYCRNDVVMLDELFTTFRPWLSGINCGVYVETDKPICPVCGCSDLKFIGYYSTIVNRYKSFRCNECKAIGRVSQSALTKVQRSKQLRAV